MEGVSLYAHPELVAQPQDAHVLDVGRSRDVVPGRPPPVVAGGVSH